MDIPWKEHGILLAGFEINKQFPLECGVRCQNQADLSAFDLAQPWRSLHACRAVRPMHFDFRTK